MLIGTWRGRGKRVKRGMVGRKFKLYGMQWTLRQRKQLTSNFIKEAGLDEEGIYAPVSLSLFTDFGILIEKKGDHKFKTKKNSLSKRGKEIKRVLALTPEDIKKEKQDKKDKALLDYLGTMVDPEFTESKETHSPRKKDK